jgi:hypothetical protein
MPDDTLIRWQKEQREQLGSAIALLFGISSASLAFCASLLTIDSLTLGDDKTWFFLSAVTFFVLAILASVGATLSRLRDFRVTVKIVEKRDKPEEKAEVEKLRVRSRRLGELTWWLFYAQLFTFCVGAVCLLITLWHVFHSKLFP